MPTQHSNKSRVITSHIIDNSNDLFDAPFRRLYQNFVSNLNSPQDILDYGCGDGSSLESLIKEVDGSFNFFGYDTDTSLKKNPKLKFINNLNSFQNSFDVIICNDVFHLVKDKVKLLKEMFELLKSGGVLALQYACVENCKIRHLTKKFIFDLSIEENIKMPFYHVNDSQHDEVLSYFNSVELPLKVESITYKSDYTNFDSIYQWIQTRFPITWVGTTTKELNKLGLIKNFEKFLTDNFDGQVYWNTERYFFWLGLADEYQTRPGFARH